MLRRMESEPKSAVLIPCHYEAATTGRVVDDFRARLPEAGIHVFGNCCTDETAEIASARGATVVREPRKGKGYVTASIWR